MLCTLKREMCQVRLLLMLNLNYHEQVSLFTAADAGRGLFATAEIPVRTGIP